MEHKLSTMDSEMNKKIEGKINNMKIELQNEVVEKIKGGLQDDVRKEVREIEDQKQRALNLICFNIAESKSKSSDDRKKHDTEKFTELCHRIGVKEIDIKLAFRLGTPQSGKIRPLEVIFNNKKHRKDILDHASNIRSISASTGLHKCIIAKDLTVRQREENKKRREERKAKNKVDELPKNALIRRYLSSMMKRSKMQPWLKRQ